MSSDDEELSLYSNTCIVRTNIAQKLLKNKE